MNFLTMYENLSRLATQQKIDHRRDRVSLDGIAGGQLAEAVKALAWAWSHYVALPALAAKRRDLEQRKGRAVREASVLAQEQKAVAKMPHLAAASTTLATKSKAVGDGLAVIVKELEAVDGAIRRVSIDPPVAGWRQHAVKFLPKLRQIPADDPQVMTKIKALVGEMVSTPFS